MSIFTGNGQQELKKSVAQRLKEANLKIGEIERQKEWLHQRLSYLLVAVNALGRHSKLEPTEAKKVIDDFIKEQEIDQAAQIEVAKEKFKQDLAAGKMPEGFKIVNNTDAPEGK
jgi:hypothetical protein